ncbi:T-complex 1 subunit beta protein [Rutstroemia sp. NJR-2017a BVV2]|nr:T-complex 1 subunit beta protein [Rutstroemia sp. NJR-2017a BVV2]PQE18386.1 T-complex 1 subunit beta protein [Rutstroemia sp. NJR-2017a BVV2]
MNRMSFDSTLNNSSPFTGFDNTPTRNMSQQVNGSLQPVHGYGQMNANSHHANNLPSQQYHINTQVAGDTQNEMLIDLRIRVALLEAELAHAIKDKDEAIKSSLVIARALGGVVNDQSRGTKHIDDAAAAELGELRLEVKRLRSENGVLWGRIESRESGIRTGDNNATKLPGASYTSVVLQNREARLSKERTLQADLATTPLQKKVSVWDDPDTSSSDTVLPVSHHEPARHSYVVDFQRSEGIPSRPPFSVNDSSPSKYTDIGICSLESLLGDNALSSPNSPTPPITDQILSQEHALAELTNAPPPHILKTGFTPAPTTVHGPDYAVWDYPEREAYYLRYRTPNRITPPDLSRGSAIWSSPQERFEEIQGQWNMTQGRGEPRLPEYFKYGIRYVPPPESDDDLRTVRIGNLPRGVELREVVARVRGGRVFVVRLLDTWGLDGGLTALVVFVNQADAEAYVEYAGANGIVFPNEDGDEGEGVPATVSLIPTPTFPLNEFQRRNIFHENRTRILSIRHFPKQISLRRLESDIARTGRWGSLCEWYLDEDETLWLEFAGIESAGVVYGMLRGRLEYRDLEVRFERDACEGGMEELAGRVERRRPLFPRRVVEGSLRDEGGEREVVDGDGDVVDSTLAVQRRRLAALRDQQVVIPGYMGEGLKSLSGGDEGIEGTGETVVGESEDDVRGRPDFHSRRLENLLSFTDYRKTEYPPHKSPTPSHLPPSNPPPTPNSRTSPPQLVPREKPES